jgi:hypothetical protein
MNGYNIPITIPPGKAPLVSTGPRIGVDVENKKILPDWDSNSDPWTFLLIARHYTGSISQIGNMYIILNKQRNSMHNTRSYINHITAY